MKQHMHNILAGILVVALGACDEQAEDHYNRRWSETLESLLTEEVSPSLLFDLCEITYVNTNGEAQDFYLASAYFTPRVDGNGRPMSTVNLQLASDGSPTCFAQLDLVDSTEFTAEMIAYQSSSNGLCSFTTGIEGALSSHGSTVVEGGRVRLDATLDTIIDGRIVLDDGIVEFVCEQQ